MTITIEQFIEQNVIANVSSLIADLAEGYAHQPGPLNPGLDDLTEQAQEALAPVPDYESAAIEEGWSNGPAAWSNVPNPEGYWGKDGETHPAGNAKAYISAEELCRAEGLDPYEHEILEHYFVSDRLADHLERHGERIVRDFAGHCVWGRTTSGQAIKCDAVIETIFAETQSKRNTAGAPCPRTSQEERS